MRAPTTLEINNICDMITKYHGKHHPKMPVLLEDKINYQRKLSRKERRLAYTLPVSIVHEVANDTTINHYRYIQPYPADIEPRAPLILDSKGYTPWVIVQLKDHYDFSRVERINGYDSCDFSAIKLIDFSRYSKQKHKKEWFCFEDVVATITMPVLDNTYKTYFRQRNHFCDNLNGLLSIK